LNYVVVQILKGIDQINEYVFMNPDTGKKRNDIRGRFHAARKRAGIDKLRFHDLRHTAATFMAQAGIDLITVAEILGHSDIKMTMRCFHPTPENKRRAVKTLAKVFDMTQIGHNGESGIRNSPDFNDSRKERTAYS